MKISKILGLALLAIGVFTFTSCTKELEDKLTEHETTAPHSAVKSMKITVYSWEWSGDEYGYYASKSAPIITSDIVNSGAVFCYYEQNYGNYVQMPITESAGQDLWIRHKLFDYETGYINFNFFDDDGASYNPGDCTFKVVTIESSKLKNSTNVDFKNYAEVKKAFNLAD